jgi:hypothetical protein
MKSKDFLKEGFVEDAASSFQDHEVQMARKDCFNAAENALALHKLLKNVSEVQGIEGWVAAKITLASDYLNTVREYLEYELMSGQQDPMISNKLPIAEGRVKQVESDLEELTSQEFKKKYNLTKEEAKKALNLPEKSVTAKHGVAEAKWRDPKYKDKLYTQEPEDSDDYNSIEYGYGIPERPDNDPGAKRPTFKRSGGNEIGRPDDVLGPSWGTGNTSGGSLKGKGISPYRDSGVSTTGARKGKLRKDATSKTKDEIRSRLKHYRTNPNLPEGQDLAKVKKELGQSSSSDNKQNKVIENDQVPVTGPKNIVNELIKLRKIAKQVQMSRAPYPDGYASQLEMVLYDAINGLRNSDSANVQRTVNELSDLRAVAKQVQTGQAKFPAGYASHLEWVLYDAIVQLEQGLSEADNPALGVDQLAGKEKLRPHTGVGPTPGTLKHKLGKMAHTARATVDYLRGKPDRMGHLEENNAGSMATVNNPNSKKPKSQVGSLFGGSYGETVAKTKKAIKR